MGRDIARNGLKIISFAVFPPPIGSGVAPTEGPIIGLVLDESYHSVMNFEESWALIAMKPRLLRLFCMGSDGGEYYKRTFLRNYFPATKIRKETWVRRYLGLKLISRVYYACFRLLSDRFQAEDESYGNCGETNH